MADKMRRLNKGENSNVLPNYRAIRASRNCLLTAEFEERVSVVVLLIFSSVAQLVEVGKSIELLLGCVLLGFLLLLWFASACAEECSDSSKNSKVVQLVFVDAKIFSSYGRSSLSSEILTSESQVSRINTTTTEQLQPQQQQELLQYGNSDENDSNVVITKPKRVLSGLDLLASVNCQAQKTRADCLAGKEKKSRMRDSPCEWCCGSGCLYDYSAKHGSFTYGKNCLPRATLYEGVGMVGKVFVNYSANGLGEDTCANYTMRYGTELFGLQGEIVAWTTPGEAVQYGLVGPNNNIYPDLLRTDNRKCFTIWDADQCFTSRDGRTGNAAGTLCQWCCGDSCDANQPWGAKCQGQQGVFSETQAGVKYLGYSKNGLGYDTCRFKPTYVNGYQFFDDLQEGDHNHDRTTLSQIYTVPELWRNVGVSMDFPEVEAYVDGEGSDLSNEDDGNNTVKTYAFSKSLSYEMNLIEFSSVIQRDFAMGTVDAVTGAVIPGLMATANVITDEYIALRNATVNQFGEMWLESFLVPMENATTAESIELLNTMRDMRDAQARQFGALFDDYYRRLLFERKREELISDLFGPARPEYAFDFDKTNYTTIISVDEDDSPSELVYGTRYGYKGLKSVGMGEYRMWKYYNEVAKNGVGNVTVPLGLYYVPGNDTDEYHTGVVNINPNYTATSIEDFMNNCNPLGTVEQHYVPSWERGTGNETYSQRSLSTVRVRDVCRRYVLNTCRPENRPDPLSRCLDSPSNFLYVPIQFLTNFTKASNTSSEEYFVSLGFEMPNTTVNHWRQTTTSTTSTTTAPPLNCVGAWGDFTACSNGQHQRSYVVSQVAEVGGTPCSGYSHGDLEIAFCGIACVGNWTAYSACNGTHEYRVYFIESPALDGGAECAQQNMTSRVRDCVSATTSTTTTSTTTTTKNTINISGGTENPTTTTVATTIIAQMFADSVSVIQVVEAVLMFSIEGSTTFEEFSSKTNSNPEDEESDTPDDVMEARQALRKLLIAAFVESIDDFTDTGFACVLPDCEIRVTHLEVVNSLATSRRAIAQRNLESRTTGHLAVEFEIVSFARAARKARATAEDANAMIDFASRAEIKMRTDPVLIEADAVIYQSIALPEVVETKTQDPKLLASSSTSWSSSTSTTTTSTGIVVFPGNLEKDQHNGVPATPQDNQDSMKPGDGVGDIDSGDSTSQSRHDKKSSKNRIDFIVFSVENPPVKFSNDSGTNAVVTYCLVGSVGFFLLLAFAICVVKAIWRRHKNRAPTLKKKSEMRRGSKVLNLQGEETHGEVVGKMVSRVKSAFAASIPSRFSGIPESRYLTSADSVGSDSFRNIHLDDDNTDAASDYSATTVSTTTTAMNNNNNTPSSENSSGNFDTNNAAFAGSSETIIVHKAQSIRNKMVQGSGLGLGIGIGNSSRRPILGVGARASISTTAGIGLTNTKNSMSKDLDDFCCPPLRGSSKRLDNDGLITASGRNYMDGESTTNSNDNVMDKEVVLYADAVVVGKPLEDNTIITNMGKKKALDSNVNINSSDSDPNNFSNRAKKNNFPSATSHQVFSTDDIYRHRNSMEVVRIESTAESRRFYEDYLAGKNNTTRKKLMNYNTNNINRDKSQLGGIMYSTSNVVNTTNTTSTNSNINDTSNNSKSSTMINKQPSIVKKMTSRNTRQKRHDKKVYDTVLAEYPDHDEVDPDDIIVTPNSKADIGPVDHSSSIPKSSSNTNSNYTNSALDRNTVIIGRKANSEDIIVCRNESISGFINKNIPSVEDRDSKTSLVSHLSSVSSGSKRSSVSSLGSGISSANKHRNIDSDGTGAEQRNASDRTDMMPTTNHVNRSRMGMEGMKLNVSKPSRLPPGKISYHDSARK